MRTFPLVVGFLALSGCLQAPVERDPAVGVVFAPAAIRPNGTPLEISFWRDRAGVVHAMERLTKTSPTAADVIPGCAEIVRFESFNLVFVDDDLRGWAVKPGAYPVVGGPYQQDSNGWFVNGVNCSIG